MLTHTIVFAEHLLFNVRAFENCLNHHIYLAEIVIAQRWLDQLEALFDDLLGEASPRYRIGIIFLNVSESTIEGGLVAFAVGGTFLPFQYTEMLWHVLALSMALDAIARKVLKAAKARDLTSRDAAAEPLIMAVAS